MSENQNAIVDFPFFVHLERFIDNSIPIVVNLSKYSISDFDRGRVTDRNFHMKSRRYLLQTLNREYCAKLEEVSELQAKCLQGISHQRYRMNVISKTLKQWVVLSNCALCPT